MRLFSILFLFLIVALAGCNLMPARTPLADQPPGTLIPTAATTPVPAGTADCGDHAGAAGATDIRSGDA
jgi:hypothetical protein